MSPMQSDPVAITTNQRKSGSSVGGLPCLARSMCRNTTFWAFRNRFRFWPVRSSARPAGMVTRSVSLAGHGLDGSAFRVGPDAISHSFAVEAGIGGKTGAVDGMGRGTDTVDGKGCGAGMGDGGGVGMETDVGVDATTTVDGGAGIAEASGFAGGAGRGSGSRS